MRAVYGIQLSRSEDRYFKMIKFIADRGSAVALPGRFMVEVIPWMQYLPSWLPGTHFLQYAAEAKRKINDTVTFLHAVAKVRSDIKIFNLTRITY